ncbi:MAG: S23 ribosomal [Planctomycetota bacterium]|nr:MAG: S23 ribosomal [Planctomycetota bacterium]
MEQTRGYRDLKAWQKGIKLAAPVYELVKKLPREELFEMSAQMRKAVVSVPANIAEGQARREPGEFLYHLGVARGSLAELDTLIEVGIEVGYFAREAVSPLADLITELRRILQGLITAIENHSGLASPVTPTRPWPKWPRTANPARTTEIRNPPA